MGREVEQERQHAVERHRAGESVSAIAASLRAVAGVADALFKLRHGLPGPAVDP